MDELSPTQISVLQELMIGNQIIIDIGKRCQVHRRIPCWQQEPKIAKKTIRWPTLHKLIGLGYVVAENGGQMRRFDPGTVIIISDNGRLILSP